jgi:hypothetical protein
VEAALLAHPDVLECAVVGAPDEERGQIVEAHVVLREGVEASDVLVLKLQEHVKRTIAPYKYPRRVVFADALPKTATGKIQRFRLREGARVSRNRLTIRRRKGRRCASTGACPMRTTSGSTRCCRRSIRCRDAHDEMLFIIQHQTSELWMKLALHEIGAARAAIAEDRLQPAFKMLARVARIFEQLNNAWDVLRTMTPSEYTHFRGKLGQSSGFQSWQYRLIEFTVGNRNPAMLRPHAHRAAVHAALEAEMARPSLYDAALQPWRGAGSRCRRRCWSATWRSPMRPIRASRGLDRSLPCARDALGALRAGREARGFRGLLPPLALQPRYHRGARHRLQAGDRGDGGCQLSQADARDRAVPRTLAPEDGPMTCGRGVQAAGFP